MAWVYAFWGLGLIAIATIAVDVLALRRKVAGRLPVVALALKGLVVAGFAGWWIYFNYLGAADTWEDLTSFAGLIVLSIPLLLIAAVLDVLVIRRLVTPVSRP